MASFSRGAAKRFPIGGGCTTSCRLEEHAYELLCACASGNLPLLLHCAKNCGNPFRNCDRLGRNVLHIAAMYGHNAIVEWILERQLVDVNCIDVESRWTPLHYSIHFGQPGTAVILMKFNANLFVKDFNRQLPLSFLSEDKKWKDKPLADKVCRAVVVEDYSPTASDELGLVKGEMVEVVKKMSYGWWKGRMGNKIGIFPSQNVKLVEHQQQEEEVEQETGSVVRINTYSWGSNSNVTLGHEMSRQYPEKLKMLTHHSTKQVVLCKFHTVFLSHRGAVFTCGHGRGGRLGHKNEQSIIEPKIIDSLKTVKCISVAAARDHTIIADERGTVYTCGLNDAHQLGLGNSAQNAPKSCLIPKQVRLINVKDKRIIAVGAGRYHSAVCTAHEVFTFGKNLGQLGLPKGLEYQIGPKQVIRLSDGSKITHLSVSDSATTFMTSKHLIYLYQNYTAKQIQVSYGRSVFPTGVECRQFQVCASLGELDSEHGKESNTTSDLSSCMIMFLTSNNELWQWNSHTKTLRPVYMKGICTNKVVHFALGKQLSVVTEQGEIYTGTASRRRHNSSSLDNSFDQFTTEPVTYYKMKSISCIQNATKIFTDFKGHNLVALQKIYGPKQYPQVEPSSFHNDLLNLCSEFNRLSDLSIEVDTQVFHGHKFILATRCPLINLLLSKPASRNNITNAVTLSNHSHIKVMDCKRPEIFHLLLEYIYSGLLYIKIVADASVVPSNGILKDIPIKDILNTSFDSTGSLDNDLTALYDDYALVNGNDNVAINNEELLNTSFQSLDSVDSSNADVMAEYGCGQAHVHFCTKKDFGILLQLAERFQMDHLSSSISSARKSGKQDVLIVNHQLLLKYHKNLEYHDIVLVSKENDKFPCHKSILAARSEYFQMMLMAGWRESSVETMFLPLSFPSNILVVIVQFLYSDEAVALKGSKNVEFVSAILITADQLLLTRLKSMCEDKLAHLLTIRNVADITSFADNYHAEQLKNACLQFICLNLAPLLEGRYLESLDPVVFTDLSQTYQSLVSVVQKRLVTFPEPRDIPESYFLDEELDSDYEAFITSLTNISIQSSGSISDKISPQSSASKKKKKRKVSDRNEPGISPVSPVVSPEPSQENMCDRRNSLTPSDGCKDERLSPTVQITTSTPQRSRLSQKGHNGTMMNRRRLSDLFQSPDKEEVSVVASRSADSVLPNVPQGRSQSLTIDNAPIRKDNRKMASALSPNGKEAIHNQPRGDSHPVHHGISTSPLARSPPNGNPWNLLGTSPPAAVSLKKLMEEEAILKRQEEQEAKNREAAAAAARAAPTRSSGWQKLSSPRNLQEGTPPPSFAAIIKAEEQEYSGKTKFTSKPMQLIQIEEEAIQALEKLYDAMDNADENITVERLQQEHGVPLWVTEHKIF